MYLVTLIPEELNRWVELPPPLNWRSEEPRKDFLLVRHQGTSKLFATELGPGEIVPVPCTALRMLPLKIPQRLKQSPCEQTKEKKIPNVAQQPGRRIARILSTEVTTGMDNLNQKTKNKTNRHKQTKNMKKTKQKRKRLKYSTYTQIDFLRPKKRRF